MPHQKFAGPCSVCDGVDPSGYYKKTMCNNCYRKQKRRARGLHKGSQKKYDGPCTICGESPEGTRYIRRMCVRCYKRVVLRGSTAVPRQRFAGPCSACGATGEKRYFNKRCPACYQYERRNHTRRPLEPGACAECGKEISRLSRTGLCAICNQRKHYTEDESVRRRVIAGTRKYQKSDKGRLITNARVSRQQKQFYAAERTLTRDQWMAILDLYDFRCAYCDVQLDLETITKDHVIPIAKGGKHSADNVVPCCLPCNVRKSNGPPPKPPRSLEGMGIL